MAIQTMGVNEFIAFMKRQQGELTDKQFAESLAVSPQYLCDIYNGRRAPGEKVADALGVTRSTTYTVNQQKRKRE